MDAIFEATVRILPRIGSHSLTTKKIADFAGISVGSLYQYFPNKESVLAALMDKAMQGHMGKFEAKLKEVSGQSMEATTSAMVDFTIDMFLGEKEKVREVFMLAPELGRITALLRLRQVAVEKLAEEMKIHHPGQPHEEYIRVSFIAVNSVMGVIHTMLYDSSQTHAREELASEIKTMLNAYFQTRASSGFSPSAPLAR